MGLERLPKNRFILLYLVWVILGGVLLWFGFSSMLGSSLYDFLVDVDELMVVVGALLLVLSLFWLKKNWSKF
jgi:amino acid transporter